MARFSVSKETRDDVINKAGGVCYYCGVQCTTAKTRQRLTIDHKTPVLRGGTHDAGNLVVACLLCNSRKGTKTEEEYTRWNARRRVSGGPWFNIFSVYHESAGDADG